MPKNTNIPIATQVITGTTTNTVTFTNIPQTYTHLIVKVKAKTIGLPAIMLGRVNGASSLYSHTAVGGTGSAPGSTRSSNIADMYFSSYAHISNTWSRYQYHFMNYSSSLVNKTILTRGSNPGYGIDAAVALWRDNAPITSITIYLDRAEYWEPGTSFTVYGVSNASIQAKATGGAIYQDDLYFYHVFANSGSFVTTQLLTTDIFAIGGGGGGMSNVGGGGGAGGTKEYSSISVASGTHTITVGAGGAGSVSYSTPGNGVASQFGTLPAAPFGYGSTTPMGSTGGASGNGYSAGNGFYPGPPNIASGGGGGAGGNGFTAVQGGQRGNGGIGVTSSLINAIGKATGLGFSVSGVTYFGGGGGGGSTGFGSNAGWGSGPNEFGLGGLGGGGNGGGGSNPRSGYAGKQYTGSGGGGGTWDNSNGSSFAGGNGASGVVIVRYLK